MPPVLRNILAVVAGLIGGSVVNMGLITVGGAVLPPPAGVDPNDMASLAAAMPSFGPEMFVFPFLAHALGTLVGALLCAKLAASRPRELALGIGALFFVGGVMAATMLPAPAWFIAVDLVAAYLPMAWIGQALAGRRGG